MFYAIVYDLGGSLQAGEGSRLMRWPFGKKRLMRWPFGKNGDGVAASASDYCKMAPSHMSRLLSMRRSFGKYKLGFLFVGVLLAIISGFLGFVALKLRYDGLEYMAFFFLYLLAVSASTVSLVVGLPVTYNSSEFWESWAQYILKNDQSPLRPRLDDCDMFKQVITAQNNDWDLYHTALAIQAAAPNWLDAESVLDCDSVISCKNESMYEKLDYKSMTEIMKIIDVMAALPAAKPEDSMVDKTEKSLREIAPRATWQDARDKVCRQHVDAQRLKREAKTREATTTAVSVLDAMETMQSDEISSRLRRERSRLELEAHSAAVAAAKEKDARTLRALTPTVSRNLQPLSWHIR